ncbi:MAG: hypothetical protein ACXQS8_06590 [Candidatus Helarchaeales archaeon]
MTTILFQIIVFDDGTMQVITPEGSYQTKLGKIPTLTNPEENPQLKPAPTPRPVPRPPQVENEDPLALPSEVDDDIRALMLKARMDMERAKKKPHDPVMGYRELNKLFGRDSDDKNKNEQEKA